jgi:murein DD-endopeptidase MepM/ murein hydrolase activator NlpD
MPALPKGVIDATLNLHERQQDQHLAEQVEQGRQQAFRLAMNSSVPALDSLLGPLSQPVQQATQTVQQAAQGVAGMGARLAESIPDIGSLLGESLAPKPAPKPVTRVPETPSGTPSAMPTGRPAGMAGPPSTGSGLPTPSPARASAPAAMPSNAPTGAIDNSSREAFVRTAYPHMLEAAGGDRNLAEMMLAKAINENGSVGSGGPFTGNNFSGIKGEGSAGSFTAQTWEQGPNGERIPTTAQFAAYRTPQEGFRAFVDLIRTSPRYQPAMARYQQTGDVEGLFRDINAAGYGTDSNWGTTIASIRRDQVAPVVGRAAAATPSAPAADQQQPKYVPIVRNASKESYWTSEGTHGGAPAADIFAPAGSPIYAPVSGTVEPMSVRDGGNAAILHGDDGRFYYMAHGNVPFRSGRVEIGQPIGEVGNSGNARGTKAHVHFSVATDPSVFDRANGSGDIPGDPSYWTVDDRQSLNAGGDALAQPASPWASADASPSSPPAGAQGDQMMLRQPLGEPAAQYDPNIPDEDQPTFSGPRPYEPAPLPADTRDIDAGPRESIPVPLNSTNLRSSGVGDDPGLPTVPTPQAPVGGYDDPGTQTSAPAIPPSPYQPEQAASMEPAPNRFEPTPEAPTVTQSIVAPIGEGVTRAGQAIRRGVEEATSDEGTYLAQVEGGAAGDAIEDWARRLFGMGPRPERERFQPYDPTGGKIEQARRLGYAVVSGTLAQDVAEELWREAGLPMVNVGGMEVSPVVLLLPGVAGGGMKGNVAERGVGLAGALERAPGAALGQVVRGARAVGEAAQGLGTRISEGLAANAERVAAADARMAASGSTVAPSTFGMSPGRPSRLPTVEVIEEQLDAARAAVQRARDLGDTEAERIASDRMWLLTDQLVDAQNARLRLEPAIESDVGRRIEQTPPMEETIDDVMAARFPSERVRPEDAADLGGPVGVPTYPGGRMNATPGVSPGRASGLLDTATRDIGSALGTSTFGAAAGAALPAETDEERRQNALIGAGIGLGAGPAMRRLLRSRGGALATPGFGPADSSGLGNVPPSRLREPTLPGMEPPYVRPDLPDVSDVPNRGRVLGDVPPSQVREPTLPGMEAPYVRPDLPAVSDVPNRSRLPGEIPAGSQSELFDTNDLIPTLSRGLGDRPPAGFSPERIASAAQQEARRVAEQRAKGLEPLSPLQWLGEAVKSVGYSSMIGPATATVNVLGNLLEPAWAIPKELTRSIVRGNPREFAEMTGGAFYGLTRTGREMVDAIRARGRYAVNPDQPTLSHRTTNRAGKAFAEATEFGGRIFSGLPDAFFGSIARYAGRAREAAQIATDEGLKGAAWKQRVDDLLSDVGAQESGELARFPDVAERIIKAGDAYADQQTFRQQLGTWGRGASKFAGRDIPVVGNFLTPFFTTPWNMGLALAERSPVGAVMNRQQGFDKAYDAVVGTALIGGLVVGPAASGMITGSGPDDPEKKAMLQAQGWKPYHTLIGDTYVPNRVFGIYGKLLNAVGDAHDAMAYQKKDGTGKDTFNDAAKRVGENIKQEPYLQGLANILEMFEAQNPMGQAEYMAASNLARLVPYAATARTIGTAMDPNERTVDKDAGIGARIGQNLGARQSLPVAQDVLGRPRENQQQGVWSVLPRLSQRRDEPLIRAFQDGGVDIGRPPAEISGVKLTPAQQRQYQAVMGRELQRIAGPTVTAPNWQNIPPSAKKTLLETFQQTARTLAEADVRAKGGRTFAEDAAKVQVDKAMGR